MTTAPPSPALFGKSTSPPAALIVGASGFYGEHIGRELAAAGWALGLHCFKRKERCEALLAEQAISTTRAEILPADLRKEHAPADLVKTFLKKFGRLDALIWAAGKTHEAPALRMPTAKFEEVLQLHLTAPFLLLKTAARTFMKQRDGVVVLLGSHAGLSGRAGGAAYAAAQSGLTALAKSAAREWGTFGVHVNVVVPPFSPGQGMGATASESFAELVRAKDVLAKARPQTGETRHEAEEAASATAAFVRSLLEKPGARASGQVFVMDGR